MAWGMFCWIPCPYTGWSEEDRDAQIGMLPLVGAGIGGITCLAWWCLGVIGSPALLTGALLTGSYFLLTGFIHLDGFMDCSDAVMPRHPKMEERQRILKDSCTGAFGAIALVLMLMITLASWDCMAEKTLDGSAAFGEIFPAAIMVFTLSRTVSAISVLKCRPMKVSQYAGTWNGGEKGAIAFALLWGLVFTAAAVCVMPEALGAMGITVVSGLITGAMDRKRLGGMNGDISGHMITLSEMMGLLTLGLSA